MSLIDDLAPETAYDVIAKVRLSGPAVLKHAATLRVEEQRRIPAPGGPTLSGFLD